MRKATAVASSPLDKECLPLRFLVRFARKGLICWSWFQKSSLLSTFCPNLKERENFQIQTKQT